MRFCPPSSIFGGVLSGVVMADLKEVGFCPAGFCPVGFCPHTGKSNIRRMQRLAAVNMPDTLLFVSDHASTP